ncbi:MAG: hypothetical protein GY842_17000 [bacterium]|nr:hypothetical protein [bacterium]
MNSLAASFTRNMHVAFVLAVITSIGCEAPRKLCTRDAWYQQKRTDLTQRAAGTNPVEQQMNKVIINAADKLCRAIQPDYLPFPDVHRTPEDIKRREEKKTLGILEIYSRDIQGVRILDDYVTDFLVLACMSNVRMGENFRIAERYKLQTILDEYDLRRSAENFDPRDAIKRGAFKGVDAIITGNVYVSQHARVVGSNAPIPGGSAQFLIRLIDVRDADVIGGTAESIPRSGLVDDWIDRTSKKR